MAEGVDVVGFDSVSIVYVLLSADFFPVSGYLFSMHVHVCSISCRRMEISTLSRFAKADASSKPVLVCSRNLHSNNILQATYGPNVAGGDCCVYILA